MKKDERLFLERLKKVLSEHNNDVFFYAFALLCFIFAFIASLDSVHDYYCDNAGMVCFGPGMFAPFFVYLGLFGLGVFVIVLSVRLHKSKKAE